MNDHFWPASRKAVLHSGIYPECIYHFLLQLFIITPYLYQQTKISRCGFLGSYIIVDFCSLSNDSLVWIKSMASYFEFRYVEMLG